MDKVTTESFGSAPKLYFVYTLTLTQSTDDTVYKKMKKTMREQKKKRVKHGT